MTAIALSLVGNGSPTVVHAAVFTQCPAIGADTGCGILITLNPGGTATIVTASAPTQPPYDSIEDTLIGVQNSSGETVLRINISGSLAIFGFDLDGICTYSFAGAAGCPFGPTGYEGPNTSFTIATCCSGAVNFIGGLTNGASAYFSLEEALTSVDVVVTVPNACAGIASLVGCWKLDENGGTSALDSSGQGNHGTLTNMPAWTPGISGSALQFSVSSSSYVYVPDSASLDIGTADFTLAAWINRSGVPAPPCCSATIMSKTPSARTRAIGWASRAMAT